MPIGKNNWYGENYKNKLENIFFCQCFVTLKTKRTTNAHIIHTCYMSHHFWSEEPFSQITILFIKLLQKDYALCVDCWCLAMLGRGVGSYLNLDGQVVMRGAKFTSSGWDRATWSGKTWMSNCPPCPPISYVLISYQDLIWSHSILNTLLLSCARV